MNRFAIGLATIILGTTSFLSAANACISCAYVPEVVSTPHPYAGKQYAKKPSSVARPDYRPAASKRKLPKPAPTEIAEAAPAPVQPVTETPEPKKPADEPTTSVAEAPSATTETPVTEKPTVTAATTPPAQCSRFFPTIGKTLPVACN